MVDEADLPAGRASTTQHHTLTPLEHLPALAAPRTRKIHFAGDVNPNIQGFMEGTVSGAERAAREGDPVTVVGGAGDHDDRSLIPHCGQIR